MTSKTTGAKKNGYEPAPGDICMDGEGIALKRVTGGWLMFGSEMLIPDEDVARPLRRMMCAGDPVFPTGDPFLYRIRYNNGKVKHGHRRVLGPVLGAASGPGFSYRSPVKIERAPEPEWEDVSGEFLGEK